MTDWAPPTRIAIGSICLIASFAMSVITWVALGDIAGYGVMRYVMPAVVDTYIACALITWLTVNDTQVATLARRNTYGAAVFGVLTQAIYHCAVIWTRTHSIWQAGLAFVCGGIPPAGAFAAAHMIIRAARVNGAASHPADASTESRQPETLPIPSTPTLPSVITTPTMPEQTATPETSPTTEAAPPPQAPTPPTPTRGSTAARGHSNTQWARGVTRPTRARATNSLTDDEWARIDQFLDAGDPDQEVGVLDAEIARRTGFSSGTIKKRRLERNRQQRTQRSGNERMARR